MSDANFMKASDQGRSGSLRRVGLVSGSVGLFAALAFVGLLSLERNPRLGLGPVLMVGLGVFVAVGGTVALVLLILAQVRSEIAQEAGALGSIAANTAATANASAGLANGNAATATATVSLPASTRDDPRGHGYDHDGYRAPSRVMTIDQALAKALLAWREGKRAKAEGLVKSAIAELEGAWPAGPAAKKDTGHERRLASALATLASFCVEQGKDSEAEPLFRRFLELGDRVFGPDHPKVAQALTNLEGLYKRIGAIDLAESIRAKREALRHSAGSTEAKAMLTRAGALFLQGKYAEANALTKQALTVREKDADGSGDGRNPVGDVGVDQYLTLLGRIESALGDLDNAEAHFLNALAIIDRNPSKDHAERGTVLWNLGQVYRKQGRFVPAEPLLTKALAIREGVGGPNSPETAECLSELALLHASKSEWAKADPCRKRAIAAWETAIRSRPRPVAVGPRYAAFLESFVNILRRNDRDAEADALAARARAVRSGIC